MMNKFEENMNAAWEKYQSEKKNELLEPHGKIVLNN